MVIPLPVSEGNFGEFPEHVAGLAASFADVVRTAVLAKADHIVTANELSDIRAKWADLVACGQKMVAALTAEHEAGKPAHLRG